MDLYIIYIYIWIVMCGKYISLYLRSSMNVVFICMCVGIVQCQNQQLKPSGLDLDKMDIYTADLPTDFYTPCSPGQYGINCSLNCSSGCHNNTCSKLDGTCLCKTKYEGPRCDRCTNGYYGDQCMRTCPKYCRSCEEINGNVLCSSCKAGLYGSWCERQCKNECTICSSDRRCHECKDGFFGDFCQYMCGIGCVNGVCNQESGSCECKEHFQSPLCTECVQGRYSKESNCSNFCFYLCDSCNNQGNCTKCKLGYYGHRCLTKCSPGCLDGICNLSDGTCKCRTNFTGANCRGCQWGALCDFSCPANCHKCLTGSQCDACATGFYGVKCDQRCPENCAKRICHMKNGACLKGCVGHWRGEKCDLCLQGYTINVQNKCVPDCRNCSNNQCDQSTGNCLSGCANYTRYGLRCDIPCPKHCEIGQDGKICWPTNGQCIYGCTTGYYGERCLKTCDEHCKDNLCHVTDGYCSKGCEDGYYGGFKTCQSDSDQSTSSVSSSSVNLAAIVFVALAVLVLGLIVTIIVAIVYSRLRRSSKNAPQHISTTNTITETVGRSQQLPGTSANVTVCRKQQKKHKEGPSPSSGHPNKANPSLRTQATCQPCQTSNPLAVNQSAGVGPIVPGTWDRGPKEHVYMDVGRKSESANGSLVCTEVNNEATTLQSPNYTPINPIDKANQSHHYSQLKFNDDDNKQIQPYTQINLKGEGHQTHVYSQLFNDNSADDNNHSAFYTGLDLANKVDQVHVYSQLARKEGDISSPAYIVMKNVNKQINDSQCTARKLRHTEKAEPELSTCKSQPYKNVPFIRDKTPNEGTCYNAEETGTDGRYIDMNYGDKHVQQQASHEGNKIESPVYDYVWNQ